MPAFALLKFDARGRCICLEAVAAPASSCADSICCGVAVAEDVTNRIDLRFQIVKRFGRSSLPTNRRVLHSEIGKPLTR